MNGVQIQPRTSYSLKCGDNIGIGCPLSHSVKRDNFEAFVYKIHAPAVEEKGLDNLENRDFLSVMVEVIVDSALMAVRNFAS